jgi:hypothetical protein
MIIPGKVKDQLGMNVLLNAIHVVGSRNRNLPIHYHSLHIGHGTLMSGRMEDELTAQIVVLCWY